MTWERAGAADSVSFFLDAVVTSRSNSSSMLISMTSASGSGSSTAEFAARTLHTRISAAVRIARCRVASELPITPSINWAGWGERTSLRLFHWTGRPSLRSHMKFLRTANQMEPGGAAVSESTGLSLSLSESHGARRWRVGAGPHFGVAASRWIDQMPIGGGRKITL